MRRFEHLAGRAAAAAEWSTSRGAAAGGIRHSSGSGGGGGGGSGGSSTASAFQQPLQQAPPPAALASAASPLAQYCHQQHAAAAPHSQPAGASGRRMLQEPVALRGGTLLAGGMALLAGGVALGAHGDRLARQQTEHEAAAAGPGAAAAAASSGNGSGGGLGDAFLRSQQWLADCLPASFLSHSQARGGGTAGAGSTAVDPRAAGAAPLGGCLSPYFISDAAAKAAPAVVNITVQAGGVLPVGSSGSGFIVEADGTILTNAHVVSDAIQRHYFGGGGSASGAGSLGPPGKGITVTLQDGRIFEGRLVSYDTVSDLAVLRVESDTPLPTARLGRSASLRVGEWVVALGSPLHLQNSVTAGIVSCVDRKAVELGLAGARTDYIQTDAAINKGNSGGPLVNLFGEVVGISAMKAVAADGVSFAIPISTAVEVMESLREHGRVIRPYVGMKMLQLNKHNAAQFRRRDANFPRVEAGILVPGVHPGSPAEHAGLRAGDVIVGFGDCTREGEVTTVALIKALGGHIGKPLALKVARPGDVTVTVTVTALEAHEGRS